MKLGFISDLHIDKTPTLANEIMEVLLREIDAQQLDRLYIGGDISNDIADTFRFVEQLQRLAGVPIYFIPGNHDLWQKGDGVDSWEIVQEIKNHPQSVQDKTQILREDLHLVSHMGWYNYAYFNRERFEESQVQRGVFKGVTWQDQRFVNWGMTDPEVSRLFAEQVGEQLASIPEGSDIILMSHVITHPAFIVPMPNRIFDFFNGYIATNDWKEFYENYPITHSIQGHVHIRHQLQAGNTRLVGNSLGYPREWWTQDLKKEINHALFVLEI